MTNKVTGELYETLTGQLFEIAHQLRQPSGYPFNALLLKDYLQAGIEGRFVQSSGTFRYDKRKDNWTLLENVSRRLKPDILIEGAPFLNHGESFISGEELARRAVTLGANYGQEDAEFLLENQHLIPRDLDSYFLVFPGTKWRDRDGDRRVPYLNRSDAEWYLRFRWLDYDFDSSDRLVRPRE